MRSTKTKETCVLMIANSALFGAQRDRVASRVPSRPCRRRSRVVGNSKPLHIWAGTGAYLENVGLVFKSWSDDAQATRHVLAIFLDHHSVPLTNWTFSMILDAKNFQEAPDFLDVPVVIIGAGTVGLFLAVNLARANIPTIVVETGGYVAGTSRSGQTAVSLGRSNSLGRAFGLGGTSTLWTGQLAEFDEMDLTAPGREWPIEYSELQQWYEHVYAFLKIKPVKLVANPFEDVRNQDEFEYGIERFVTSYLPQQNFAVRFRADVNSSPWLKVILNATANDILFEGSKATAVCVGIPGGRNIKIPGRNFVFASGTLETSRFFLSTQRRSEVPWRHNKNIGAYFQDHFVGRVANVQILDERKFRDYFENGFVSGMKFQPKLRNWSGFKRPAYSGVVGSFWSPSQLQQNLGNVTFLIRTFRSGIAFSKLRTLLPDLWSLRCALIPFAIRFARHHRIRLMMDRGMDFNIQSEQIPTVESVIRLMDEEPNKTGCSDRQCTGIWMAVKSPIFEIFRLESTNT